MYRFLPLIILWLVTATVLFVLARVDAEFPIAPRATMSVWTVGRGDVAVALDTQQNGFLQFLVPLRLLWTLTLIPLAGWMFIVVWRRYISAK